MTGPEFATAHGNDSSTDDQARLLAEQILGSTDHAWTGDWHQTLQNAAAHWATQPATPNPHNLAA
ncbi:hypothetical protein ACWEGQ_00435 [Streptomyces seoulensis]